MLTIWVNAELLATIVAASIAGQRTLDGHIIALLSWLTVSVAAGYLLNTAAAGVQQLFQLKVAQRCQIDLATKASELDLSFYEQPRFHNLLQNASQQSSTRPLLLVQQLIHGLSALVTLISLSVGVARWNYWLLLLAIGTATAQYFVASAFNSEKLNIIEGRASSERRAQYLSSLLASYLHVKELRVLSLKNTIIGNLKKIKSSLYAQDARFIRRRFKYVGVTETIIGLGQPISIAYVVLTFVRGGITFAQFSFISQSIVAVHSSIGRLLAALVQLHESRIFIRHLTSFLALKPEVEAVRPNSTRSSEFSEKSIEFRNVSFTYPETSREVLNDISFVLKPGDVIGIAGENGCGKSTLIKLIAGLYNPSKGVMLVNGCESCAIDRAEMRDSMAFLFQDFQILQVTARENIAFGRATHPHTNVEIEQAALSAGIDEVLTRLPNKYDTVLSRSLDNGHELSGGQRQMVALARLILRDAHIVVLDEPTSALDATREKVVLSGLFEDARARGKCVLLCSHSSSALSMTDKVLVLERGSIVQSGPPAALAMEHGAYTRLFGTPANNR
jgi:ATP-binding cassette, subfamily B, bacterial